MGGGMRKSARAWTTVALAVSLACVGAASLSTWGRRADVAADAAQGTLASAKARLDAAKDEGKVDAWTADDQKAAEKAGSDWAASQGQGQVTSVVAPTSEGDAQAVVSLPDGTVELV